MKYLMKWGKSFAKYQYKFPIIFSQGIILQASHTPENVKKWNIELK